MSLILRRTVWLDGDNRPTNQELEQWLAGQSD